MRERARTFKDSVLSKYSQEQSSSHKSGSGVGVKEKSNSAVKEKTISSSSWLK